MLGLNQRQAEAFANGNRSNEVIGDDYRNFPISRTDWRFSARVTVTSIVKSIFHSRGSACGKTRTQITEARREAYFQERNGLCLQFTVLPALFLRRNVSYTCTENIMRGKKLRKMFYIFNVIALLSDQEIGAPRVTQLNTSIGIWNSMLPF